MTNYSLPRSTPDLRTFMQELEARLEALSNEELKSLLMQRARGLAPKERNDFLAMFPAVSRVEDQMPKASARDDELIADIEAFVEALEDGEYFDGYGWDDSSHDHRAFGDESWVEEMDDLFARTSEIYLAGHRDLALEAYDKLLHAFEFGEEAGHFCGEDSPESMVKTDVTEAKARYLRCIYETVPLEDRIPRMLEEIQDLHNIGEQTGLRDIINADTRPLSGIEEFLRAWIADLKALDAEGTAGRRLRWWRPLLREAVVLQDGVNGLAGLARESGDIHPEAYQDWAMALCQSGDISSAISVAREGVERIISGGERARLADALANMSACTGDSELAVAARKQAWRANPSLRRLLLYCNEGSPDRRTLDVRLGEELAGASDGDYTIPSASYHSAQTPRLLILLQLLAHDYDAVIQHVGKIEPLGWSSSEHPGPVVFPFLTLAASGKTDQPAEGSSLACLLDEIAGSCSGWGDSDHLLPNTTDEPIESMLSGLLLDTMACHTVTPEDRAEYLDMATTIAERRIDAIVSNTHRGAYERAARLAVAIGGAMALQGNTSGGMNFTLSFREVYPRHIAFRRELEQLIERSPCLPSLPRRKK